jgi:hypothetical protein
MRDGETNYKKHNLSPRIVLENIDEYLGRFNGKYSNSEE